MNALRRFEPLWIILLLIAASGAAYFLTFEKSSRIDEYVCVECGIKSRHIRKWHWLLKTTDVSSLQDTIVSAVFYRAASAPHNHSWRLIYWDYHGRHVSGHGAPGATEFELLFHDQNFADQLQTIAATNSELAHKVWKSVSEASFRGDPRRNRVYSWLVDHENREPLFRLYQTLESTNAIFAGY